MKNLITFYLFSLLFFFGCSTVPKIYETTPSHYEDEDLKITAVIGAEVYSIIIENKGSDEVIVDTTRFSIISIDGETRTLNIVAEDSHIPGKSKLIYYAAQDTFFVTDPYAPFYSPFKEPDFSTSIYSDNYIEKGSEEYLRLFIGQYIRLYFPVLIRGEEVIYDLIFNLTDIRQFK